MLQPLLGRWDREEEEGGEGEEGGGMKMGQGHGLRLYHGLGVELPMGLSVCTESGGNGGDASLEGEWVTRLCWSV